MKTRKWIAAAIILLTLFLAGCQADAPERYVQAATENQQSEAVAAVVYVTDTGSKYHASGCRYLKYSCREISLTEAKEIYEPCSVCRPPV